MPIHLIGRYAVKTFLLFVCVLAVSSVASAQTKAKAATLTISKATLQNKIKGGWAGQTIGVTFGGPTEFRYNGTFIQDYQKIAWYNGYLKKTMTEWPDLYDDIYMDLTFVDILERVGMDAPVDSFANAFAHAKYNLWHANQAARYNILKGLKAPATGHWLNNPHADDIDFQIEADFSGLMAPAMPNTAINIGDKIGHIMNYGDGWYGGVFIGAMYSQAFTSHDLNYIVESSLKAIPQQSQFYRCIADVVKWHKLYPADWKRCWFELQRTWAEEHGCPEGVLAQLDIDAKLNAAYVTMGLLYGNGDFTKTMEIATRTGQDSDCNPSSAGGILGVVLGYDKIPAYWKQGLKEVEDMDFKYTTMSLNKVYSISMKHALHTIKANGGKVDGDKVTIKLQTPARVRLEQSFQGMTAVEKQPVKNESKTANTIQFTFTGAGFVVRGAGEKRRGDIPDGVIKAEIYLDGEKIETADLPTSFTTRRYDLFWKYQLPNKQHTVKIVILNPDPNYELRIWDNLVYTDKIPARASL
ncbi:ADP-ribosylglycohydrolase family protein [Mucilaginibacter myungsuensis]|uniref:ADP-ribosylglycohydrolase family protein n=2 Tax=Mucilaginibacter myungsuensis TaxID=649104 RepID=A0A929L0Y1_9SPHI|nr:ADP-ribosylglycohydrolase family protein [Mucilaginibacter myungsuensis]